MKSKNSLEILADDEVTLKALEELFNDVVKRHMPNVTSAIANNIIGEEYRAYDKAKDILDDCLLSIKSYKRPKDVDKNFNKER